MLYVQNFHFNVRQSVRRNLNYHQPCDMICTWYDIYALLLYSSTALDAFSLLSSTAVPHSAQVVNVKGDIYVGKKHDQDQWFTAHSSIILPIGSRRQSTPPAIIHSPVFTSYIHISIIYLVYLAVWYLQAITTGRFRSQEVSPWAVFAHVVRCTLKGGDRDMIWN